MATPSAPAPRCCTRPDRRETPVAGVAAVTVVATVATTTRRSSASRPATKRAKAANRAKGKPAPRTRAQPPPTPTPYVPKGPRLGGHGTDVAGLVLVLLGLVTALAV